MRRLALVGMVLLTVPVFAQSGVGVEVEEVVDNRLAAGDFHGGLELRVKLKGSNLDRALGARIVVKEAKDDRGNDVTPSGNFGPPGFMPREYNSGTLQLSTNTPARAASTVKIKGTVELFVPTRDPNAIVKVDKPLAKLDAPISSAALKNAKISITPMSAAGYAKLKASQKLDDKKIAEIRERAKKEGVPEKELELALELAKAMDGMDTPPGEGTIILAGTKQDFERIYKVEILDGQGKPIDLGARTTTTRGDDSMMTLQPPEPPPANAALQVFVITDKSKMSFPFELTVKLP